MIGPTAALQYSSEEINSFSEHGSFVPLNVSSDIQDSLTTDLGFRDGTMFILGRWECVRSIEGRFPRHWATASAAVLRQGSQRLAKRQRPVAFRK
jgi:uncharacterized protein with beta-barrel porin domain